MRIVLNNSLTTFEQLFDDFLTSSKAKGLSKKTLETYDCHRRILRNYLNLNVPVEDISKRDLELID